MPRSAAPRALVRGRLPEEAQAGHRADESRRRASLEEEEALVTQAPPGTSAFEGLSPPANSYP